MERKINTTRISKKGKEVRDDNLDRFEMEVIEQRSGRLAGKYREDWRIAWNNGNNIRFASSDDPPFPRG